MKLKEAIEKDGQRHLYVKSTIISGTSQYMALNLKIYFNHLCVEIRLAS